MSEPCPRCGEYVRPVPPDQPYPRVAISFTPSELAQLAIDSADVVVRARLLCGLSLLDPGLASELRAAMGMPPASYAP